VTDFQDRIRLAQEWIDQPRFEGITRLYSAREIAEQQGNIDTDYTVARTAAEAFYTRLRELFEQRKAITTFGPYSPSQAVSMKRMGIEGIYLGGWATSAKGSITEDPGADLASYPLSQVPDEAAPIVRALLTADRNQAFQRSRMTAAQRAATPEFDFRPFIIADADTGHGGDAHVRNLIRRFAEIGVPGYHMEDQKPGVKKCGHQGGKVLVPEDEQIKRLNAARFQLDCMRVPGIIVARTDAEAASFIEGRGDERDHPFILGATRTDLPSYKAVFIATLQMLHRLGVEEVRGHLLFRISEQEAASARAWMEQAGVLAEVKQQAKGHLEAGGTVDPLVNSVTGRVLDAWQSAANMMTYGDAVAAAMKFQESEGAGLQMSIDEWNEFAKTASHWELREKSTSMGLDVTWDCELSKTPEGYYPIQCGIDYAIAKSLAAAPYADLLWMETKTADMADAKKFADAIHAQFPNKMLAYNLSPSFNWDTTGMTDDEMKKVPEALGNMGFVFNFITYGGHQIDGLAGEEFATALRQEGMLALAKLQRKFRLLESPYRTPQTHVGGPRLDAALMASSGRTASTKAMGKGSTQFQHLIQTEVPKSVLAGWLELWCKRFDLPANLQVSLRPHDGYELMELALMRDGEDKVANIIFASIQDRRRRNILSVRDQNTFDESMRQKRLMTLMHLFLIHRYKSSSVHYLTPTDDNRKQTQGMQRAGIFSDVKDEIGQLIVAEVNDERVKELLATDNAALTKLIEQSGRSH
jgi:isocitrate lyase